MPGIKPGITGHGSRCVLAAALVRPTSRQLGRSVGRLEAFALVYGRGQALASGPQLAKCLVEESGQVIRGYFKAPGPIAQVVCFHSPHLVAGHCASGRCQDHKRKRCSPDAEPIKKAHAAHHQSLLEPLSSSKTTDGRFGSTNVTGFVRSPST